MGSGVRTRLCHRVGPTASLIALAIGYAGDPGFSTPKGSRMAGEGKDCRLRNPGEQLSIRADSNGLFQGKAHLCSTTSPSLLDWCLAGKFAPPCSFQLLSPRLRKGLSHEGRAMVVQWRSTSGMLWVQSRAPCVQKSSGGRRCVRT